MNRRTYTYTYTCTHTYSKRGKVRLQLTNSQRLSGSLTDQLLANGSDLGVQYGPMAVYLPNCPSTGPGSARSRTVLLSVPRIPGSKASEEMLPPTVEDNCDH